LGEERDGMSSYLDATALRNVVVVSMVLGVGVTLLFSVAVRALATADQQPHSSTGLRLLATGCLLIVLAAVAMGLWAVLAK
jgi:type VI protein secretion system component VasK